MAIPVGAGPVPALIVAPAQQRTSVNRDDTRQPKRGNHGGTHTRNGGAVVPCEIPRVVETRPHKRNSGRLCLDGVERGP
jgi:hypothetical protein